MRDFRFFEPLSGRNREAAEQIQTTNAISVHVRRGDYATNPATQAFHGILPAEYYRAAVREVSQAVRNPHFYVFSDDPDWCRHNLDLGHSTTFVDHNRARGSDDLRLMSLCAHHIIANSSFSWWGAWLNPREEKIVIAPRRWVADSSIDARDVVPARWIQL